MNIPKGFRAIGLPRHDRPRPSRHGLAFFMSDTLASAAACYTTNQVKCVHIPIDQAVLKGGKAQAIMVNSGCANCCTGARGVREARQTIRWAEEALKVSQKHILIASTGVIGDFMPMELLSEEIPMLAKPLLTDAGHTAKSFHKAAEAIMTTDTVVKIAHQSFLIDGKKVRLWGCAKGAGMIHPLMTQSGSLKGRHATMLGFLMTDAAIASAVLQKLLNTAVDHSFNRVTVDGDMSTNDTVLVLANGASGATVRKPADVKAFGAALEAVCIELSKKIAIDGEGATKFLEIRVAGARTEAEAQRIAMTVATSPLVKTAAYGEDSNWGRILAAIGRSGVALHPERIDICFGDLCVFKKGAPTAVTAEQAREPLRAKQVVLHIDLHLGKARGFYWTCDFTGQYVDINARYRT